MTYLWSLESYFEADLYAIPFGKLDWHTTRYSQGPIHFFVVAFLCLPLQCIKKKKKLVYIFSENVGTIFIRH